MDVVSNGIKAGLELRRRPPELARIPAEELMPVVNDGGREEFLPLQVRVTLALAFRRAADCLEAGVTSPIMHKIQKVFGVIIR